MDYKEKYEQVLERAKSFKTQELRDVAEYIFPELKESEDERIRKELIEKVKETPACIGFNDKNAVLVWLEKQGEPEDKGEISDGYHTFNELYYYRLLYNAAFFNLLPKEWVHKSKKHHDGEECFGGGWFIVMANLPTGQISNHYELKDWDLFQIPEKEVADEWDGHTPQEAADRLHKYLLEKQGEQKPANKVEPKFHKGQWIVWQDKCYKVNYNGCGYELTDQNGLRTSLEYGTVDKSAHLWTIDDAKDGDVVVDKSDGAIGIFQGILHHPNGGSCNNSSYCFLYCRYNGFFYAYLEHGNTTGSDDLIPATKEQRDLLFQKMKEAGYGWDAEKKELKKIEQHLISNYFNAEYERGKADALKSVAWSEEDENRINHLIAYFEDKEGFTSEDDIAYANWLKSLKNRVLPHPKQEWSEEDKRILDALITSLINERFAGRLEFLKGIKVSLVIDWLKSLKEKIKGK